VAIVILKPNPNLNRKLIYCTYYLTLLTLIDTVGLYSVHPLIDIPVVFIDIKCVIIYPALDLFIAYSTWKCLHTVLVPSCCYVLICAART